MMYVINNVINKKNFRLLKFMFITFTLIKDSCKINIMDD